MKKKNKRKKNQKKVMTKKKLKKNQKKMMILNKMRKKRKRSSITSRNMFKSNLMILISTLQSQLMELKLRVKIMLKSV